MCKEDGWLWKNCWKLTLRMWVGILHQSSDSLPKSSETVSFYPIADISQSYTAEKFYPLGFRVSFALEIRCLRIHFCARSVIKKRLFETCILYYLCSNCLPVEWNSIKLLAILWLCRHVQPSFCTIDLGINIYPWHYLTSMLNSSANTENSWKTDT